MFTHSELRVKKERASERQRGDLNKNRRANGNAEVWGETWREWMRLMSINRVCVCVCVCVCERERERESVCVCV